MAHQLTIGEQSRHYVRQSANVKIPAARPLAVLYHPHGNHPYRLREEVIDGFCSNLKLNAAVGQ